MLSVAKIMQHW